MRVRPKGGGARRLLACAVAALCVAACLAAAGGAQPLAASTVRGRVDRQSRAGTFPAPYVRVTVLREGEAAAGRLQSYTGKDGMYYFKELQPGNYVLEVWSDEDRVLGRYRIVVQDKPFTDIRPIVIS